ncbi:histidine kinase [Leptolyngbya cf. ectocarpi LEGE 11479]|uniref:Adaptive-response sensory-kinase SasA n=1 Tax=Leptolyngbya cf. ectocarpi LEGE 11479 TaxID=1828722 RepID=A0A928ZXA4_LEPEC|nr:histidine kinase [Leptolyngbya ectocarpi]MBE9069206.1 histidine kinase [Leptolyngbya cf. ectocarpi LEGE 11479]
MPSLEVPLKLLLFIDKRPSSTEQVRQIRQHVEMLASDIALVLEVIDVSEQPYLAEHFKLVVTPTLIKVSAAGRQTLTGSDIISQIDYWWSRWQSEVTDKADIREDRFLDDTSIAQSTEIIHLSDEIFRLKQLNAEANAKLEFKDRIIAMLAHDLRNPLTAASIAIETLAMGYDPNHERRSRFRPELTVQLLSNAKTQIRSIDRMITDILQAAHGPSVDLHIFPKELRLQELCREVRESMLTKVKGKEQTLELDIPQDLPQVHADINQVRRVIVNLLDNAVKYTPIGGKVMLTALHRTTQKVQISIQDTGPGIPADKQARIFEESFRLQRDQSQDGYGLGLALCLRIVRAHYGQIWVDSVPQQGSTFHFTLPVYKQSHSRQREMESLD